MARAQRGTEGQAIGRSKGMTTKILALTDALGNLVRFVLLPGHRFDTVVFGHGRALVGGAAERFREFAAGTGSAPD